MFPDVFAKRMSRASSSKTMMVASVAKQMIEDGKEVIDLSLGDPALDETFPMPQQVLDAAVEAVQKRKYSYTPSNGLLALRRAVAKKFQDFNGLDYSPDTEITICAGVKQAMFNCFFATIEEGDEVILPCPSWLSYADITNLLGGKCVYVDATMENNFKITPAQLKAAITPKTKWFVLISPNNPTGAAYTEEELKALAEVLKNSENQNILVIADEIYEYLTYDKSFKQVSFAKVASFMKDKVVTIGGTAKSHSMTGWRVGYVGAHKDIISKLNVLHTNETSCPSAISQYAMIAAMEDGSKTARVYLEELRIRKDYLTKSFKETGFIEPNNPEGGFYIFSSIEKIIGKTYKGKVIDSDVAFCMEMLENCLVAVTPGMAFNSPNHFRLSLGANTGKIKLAGERFKDFCKELV